MANAALLYENLADVGAISASGAVASMPASLLLNPHIQKRWRCLGASAYFVCDLGASQAPDVIALLGLTLGASGTVRLRVSTDDATGAEGDSLDTGVLTSSSAYFDPDYGAFIYVGDAAEGRYIRFDLADAGAAYLEAGRLVAGVRTAFETNYSQASSRGWQDPSRKTKTEGGQTLVQRRPKFRLFDFGFDFVTQWASLVEVVDRRCGTTEDVMLIENPESDNLPRDCVWGQVADLTPIALTPISDVVTKQYRIEERL